MTYDFSMPALWEREADYYHRRQRNQGLTPYQDVAKWRRRAWFWLLLAVVEGVALLLFGHAR